MKGDKDCDFCLGSRKTQRNVSPKENAISQEQSIQGREKAQGQGVVGVAVTAEEPPSSLLAGGVWGFEGAGRGGEPLGQGQGGRR